MGCGGSKVEDLRYPVKDKNGYFLAYKKGSKWVNWWARNKPKNFFLKSYCAAPPDNSGVPSQGELDKILPVKKPFFVGKDPGNFSGIRATWIGHATVLAEVDSTIVITDPIFSKRASWSQWHGGAKRFRPPACTVDDLPEGLKVVLISHTHYDHLDKNSVRDLDKRYGSNLHWFVPEGIGDWLRSNVKCQNIHDMVWWQQEVLPGTKTKVALTPSNHWGRRGCFDENKALWGSFVVTGSEGHKFWFAGDTAYCNAFKQIGKKYGPIDLSAIPIGSYEPRFILKFVHVNPKEAVAIHQDLKSKESLGIHWATFKLSKEPYMEPKKKTKFHMKQCGLDPDDFHCVNIGATVEVK